MSSFDSYIDLSEFGEFEILAQNNFTIIATSQKNIAPSRKYIFKFFQYECNNTKDQKIFLDTFYQISKTKNPYLRSYNYLSLTYESRFTPTFSMKYKSSKTLEKVLRTPSLLLNLTIENIMHCLFAVAEGMSYLHSHLIYHGNLCPSNIIIDEANQFYLIDFGLYSIKSLYMNNRDLFNDDYKDSYMKNNQPSFINDIYSYGVLICDIFLSFFKAKKTIEKEETLKNFLRKNNKNKFDVFPPFCAELITACLNSFITERPSFNHIIEKFKNADVEFYGINVKNLYNEFIDSNYLLNLASINDPIALNKVGKMYEKGKVFEKNYLKALEFYEKAANLNYSDAQNNYGVLLQKIAGDNESDLMKGAHYLQLSAEQGDVRGMASYGIALLNGIGVEKNFPKAGEYLQKSADLGCSFAQVNYGFILLDNNPIFLGVSEGLNYIKKAMNQKDPDAYYIFGVLLKQGKFIEKNDRLALEYLKIAADMGNEKAIIELNGSDSKETENSSEKIIPKEISIKPNENKKIEDESKTDDINKQLEQSNGKENEPEQFVPTKISSKITLISPGIVVYNRANYHTENYIYPVGYQVKRKYYSIENPNELTTYLASVLDGGDSPIFRVESLDGSKKVFEGRTPTAPWSQVLLAIENSKKQLNIKNNNNDSISGPAAYGFSTAKISYLIERLPFAVLCTNYKFRTLNQENEEFFNENQNNEIDEEKVENEKNAELTPNEPKINNEQQQQQTNINISSNVNDEVNLYLSTEDLIKQGDKFAEKNDFIKASKCYNEVLKRGNKSILFKCADVSSTFEEKLDYLKLAMNERIPKSFNKLRMLIMKQVSLTKEKEKLLSYAKLLEGYQDFSDAAIIYDQINDTINSKMCFEKAKQNIDDIKDGYRQYDFADYLMKHNENELAMIMFQKAVENNVPNAQNKINELNKNKKLSYIDSILQNGINYFKGINGKEKSTEKAMVFFEKASKLGCPKADFYIGYCNINDYGIDHLKKAADAGDPDAQNRYAYYLEKGILMKENKEEAKKYYKLAVDQEHPEAMFEYGKDLYENSSKEELKKEGINYLKKSADKMFPDAIYMYSKICKDTNPEDSKRLFELSLEKGSQLALKEQELNQK